MKKTFSYRFGRFLISVSDLGIVDDDGVAFVGVAFVGVALGSEVEIVVTMYGAALGMGVATAGGLVVGWNTLMLTYLGLEWDSVSSEGGEGGL